MKDELFTLQYQLKQNTTDVRNMKTSITDATNSIIRRTGVAVRVPPKLPTLAPGVAIRLRLSPPV